MVGEVAVGIAPRDAVRRVEALHLELRGTRQFLCGLERGHTRATEAQVEHSDDNALPVISEGPECIGTNALDALRQHGCALRPARGGGPRILWVDVRIRRRGERRGGDARNGAKQRDACARGNHLQIATVPAHHPEGRSAERLLHGSDLTGGHSDADGCRGSRANCGEYRRGAGAGRKQCGNNERAAPHRRTNVRRNVAILPEASSATTWMRCRPVRSAATR